MVSHMVSMQNAMLFKQRPQALPSMIYIHFITQIILYVELVSLWSHKISQNIGFFNKNSWGGPRFFFSKAGAIDMAAMTHLSRWEGHSQGGGGGSIGKPGDGTS